MIREALPEDYSACQEIALACFDKNIAKYKNLTLARMMVKKFYKDKNVQKRLDKDSHLFVDDENSVRGFIEIRDDGYIANIFVSPKCQHQGIGQQLMKHAETYVVENTEDDSIVISLDASKDAIRFYEKCGFIFQNRSHSSLGVEMYPMKKTVEINKIEEII